jgi:hypothetical protein
MIKTIPISKEWLASLKRMGFTADTIFDKGQYENLKIILLSCGGEAVVFPQVEPDYKNIFVKGLLLTPPKVKLIKGKPNDCHRNAADNYEKFGWLIFTGYALSEDGVWRQHSWNFGKDFVETTEKRIAYYGYPLDENESNVFIFANR